MRRRIGIKIHMHDSLVLQKLIKQQSFFDPFILLYIMFCFALSLLVYASPFSLLYLFLGFHFQVFSSFDTKYRNCRGTN
jgi:hypothetical protein